MLSLSNVSASYGSVPAVGNVSIEVGEGEEGLVAERGQDPALGDLHSLGIPLKANAVSGGNAKGIPIRRRTVLGA